MPMEEMHLVSNVLRLWRCRRGRDHDFCLFGLTTMLTMLLMMMRTIQAEGEWGCWLPCEAQILSEVAVDLHMDLQLKWCLGAFGLLGS